MRARLLVRDWFGGFYPIPSSAAPGVCGGRQTPGRCVCGGTAVLTGWDVSALISFSVANRTRLSIEVYNILGQKVRTVADEVFEPGSYSRMWDGRSDAGTQVSSGIYFYKMVAGDFSATKKTVLLK